MSIFDFNVSLERLILELEFSLQGCPDDATLENIRVDFFGRNGRLAQIVALLPKLALDERPAAGRAVNRIKNILDGLFLNAKSSLKADQSVKDFKYFDPTLPGRTFWQGSLHPINAVIMEICTFFAELGYEIVTGPEAETNFYNFEALNIPDEHPARDIKDTFYVTNSIVLRTHTSPLQVRTMLARKPPVAVIAPGKVYRRDSDFTHTPMFHQVEGFLVNTDISMADLRGTITAFIHNFFGTNISLRFRPSFFPFTAPSAEVDISCVICGGTGLFQGFSCRVCKQTGWLEILGSGMVGPEVFKAVGYDPEIYTGFAFGLGVERVAMLKYGIGDIRMFFKNDIRFLRWF
ncbi:phenylalanine--tRNA ligase subunit alpha [Desulfovibrionales bacterium]